MKRLVPGRRLKTPSAAVEMAARRGAVPAGLVPLAWDDGWDRLVLREYRNLRYGDPAARYAGWRFVSAADRVWDDAEKIDVPPFLGRAPRWAYKGNCNDFAPELRRRLIAAGVPAESQRLVICEIEQADGGPPQAHMVLAIETDGGTLVCDNIQGCWGCDAPAFRQYRWLAAEDAEGWHALADGRAPQGPTLADLVAPPQDGDGH